MDKTTKAHQKLLDENKTLRSRLEEEEQTLRAIRQHAVDAFVVSTPGGTEVVTLKGADYPYRVMVESMGEGAVTLMPDGPIFFCNPRFAEMVQTPSEKLIGSPFQDLIAPDEQSAFATLLKASRQTSARGDFYIQTITATRVPVQLSVRHVETEEMRGISIVVTDLTERKRAEAELSKLGIDLQLALKGYERVLDNSLDVICSIDEEGRFASVSKASSKIWGYEPNELIGKLYMDLVHPDDHAITVQAATDIMAGNSVTTFENRYLHKDGRIIPIMWSSKWVESDKKMFCVARDTTVRKQTEQSLADEQERLRLTIRSANVGLWNWDLCANTVSFSPEWKSQLGYRPDEISNDFSEWETRVHPDDIDRAIKEVTAFIEGRSPAYEIDFRIEHKDGNYRWILAQASLLKNEHGKPVRVIGSHIDITERKRSDEALRKSEERLRLLFEQMKDGFYYSTPDGQLLDINPAMIEMFGYSSREEMLKVEVTRDLYFSPEDRKSQTLDDGKDESEIYRMRRKDGSAIWVEDRGQYKYDEEGKIAFHQGILRDVTKRKLTEDSLIQSEERYRQLVENAYDVIYTRDMDGNNTSINAAGEKLTGYSREEFLQLNISQIVVPEHLDRVKEKIAQKLSGIEGTSYEMDILGKDDRRITLEVNTTLIYRAGAPVGVQGIARDITERKRIENQLIESESHKGAIFESALDCIIAINGQGLVTEFNPAAETVFGYSRADAMGQELAELIIPPALRDQHHRGMEHYLATGEGPVIGKRFEISAMRSDGSEFPVELSINAIEISGTTVFTAFLRDISERKLVENNLIRSEERYRDLVENAYDGIFTLDLGGTFTSANKACEHITGYSYDENQGLKFQEIVAPEYIDTVKEMIVKKLEGELATAYGIEIVAKDGQRVAIEVNSRLMLKDGIPVGVQGIARDVTERKKAENALKLAEEKYRSIFENAVDGLFQSTPEGRFTAANPALAKILGYESPEELISHRTDIRGQHYVDPDCRANLVKTLEKHGTVTGFECEVYRKDLSKIWTVENIRTIRDESGTLLYYEGSLEDITGQKLLEEHLRQSQKLESVGRLAGGIAHDFNNMLTAINGFSDLTLRRMKADDPLRRNIQEIKKAGERSAALTNQLLAFSRQQILQPEVVYLNRVITETSTLLERTIGEDVKLVTDLHPKTGKVKADPGQLSQIIMNLAVNARDAMPDGGNLMIETTNVFLDPDYARQHVDVLPGPYVVLSVSDTGTGMTSEEQEKIFEPFFTTKEVGKGTGLGLAIVYGIVKQSGGGIFVYSEVGHGTTFKIYLPRVMEKSDIIQTNSDLKTEFAMGSETILLVEDEDSVRSLSRQILETCGYTVIEARDGIEALEIMRTAEIPVDLLLTDVIMPRMGGRELAEKLLIKMPDLPVLFASGYTDNAIVRHGVLETNVNFIQKPYSLDDLARMVRELLDTKR